MRCREWQIVKLSRVSFLPNWPYDNEEACEQDFVKKTSFVFELPVSKGISQVWGKDPAKIPNLEPPRSLNSREITVEEQMIVWFSFILVENTQILTLRDNANFRQFLLGVDFAQQDKPCKNLDTWGTRPLQKPLGASNSWSFEVLASSKHTDLAEKFPDLWGNQTIESSLSIQIVTFWSIEWRLSNYRMSRGLRKRDQDRSQVQL